jgi:hypothetical protein
MGTFFRSRRPILPLALWATTTALAYAAGKRRRSGDHARTGILRRRASARSLGSGRSRA